MLCAGAAKPNTRVIVATIQSLAARYLDGRHAATADEDASAPRELSRGKEKKPPRATLLIVDEAHGALAATYLALAEAYPHSCLVGLTATPYRLDPHESLAKLFGEIVWGPTVSELIARGNLVSPNVFGIDVPCDASLAESASTMGEAARLWHRHADGAPTVAFCTTIKHSRALVETLGEAGVAAEHIDGSLAV